MTDKKLLIQALEATERALQEAAYSAADMLLSHGVSDDEHVCEALAALESVAGVLEPLEACLRIARQDLVPDDASLRQG